MEFSPVADGEMSSCSRALALLGLQPFKPMGSARERERRHRREMGVRTCVGCMFFFPRLVMFC